jgi:hypothetical protein
MPAANETKQEVAQKTMQQLMAADPWWSESTNLDTSSLSPETRTRLGLDKAVPDDGGPDADGFGGLTETGPKNLRAMLQNPTAEMLESLAESDPSIRARLAEENAERVNLEFRKAHPAYLKTPGNFQSLVNAMALEHLGVDHLSADEAYAELCESGKWTLPNLSSAFARLQKAGALDVPKGTARELTREEKLRVIALIRTWDVGSAIASYLNFAVGTPSEPWTSPEDLVVRYPETANRAAAFCWYHSQTEAIDQGEFNQFLKSQMAGRPLWTVELLGSAWSAYKRGLTSTGTTPAEEAPRTDPDFDGLSDADFQALRLQAFAEHRKRRSQRN